MICCCSHLPGKIFENWTIFDQRFQQTGLASWIKLACDFDVPLFATSNFQLPTNKKDPPEKK